MNAMKNDKIWLSSPHMSGNEMKYIDEAFRNNHVFPLGPNVSGLEADLCRFTGAAHCSCLSSGTAAIHLALILLGVEQGDEVICSSFTFSASANPIVYQKALPVFVDSEPDSWNMSPELLETAIRDRISKGKKPKAIIAVHLYGMPARMDRIMAIARQYEIPVVEDAAEALGSTYNGQACGTFGDIGILSFNGNKIITTSGGGAMLSSNPEYCRKATFLATQARDAAPHYQHSHIGYNYRMSNISAGIGRGQMEVLPQRIAKRRENYEYYHNASFVIPAQAGTPSPSPHSPEASSVIPAKAGIAPPTRTAVGTAPPSPHSPEASSVIPAKAGTAPPTRTAIPGLSFLTEPSPLFFSNHWLTTILVDPELTGGITREHIRLEFEKRGIESRPLWKPMHLQPVFAECPAYIDGTSEKLFDNGLCLPSSSNITDGERQYVAESLRAALL